MKQVRLLLFLIILLNEGCVSNDNKEDVVSNERDCSNIITNYYNDQNLLEKQMAVNSEKTHGVLVERKAQTNYFYDGIGRLTKVVRINLTEENSLNSDSAVMFYDYNQNDDMTRKVHIDYNGDTLELEKNKYLNEGNVKYIERTTIKKSFMPSIAYDTTVYLIKEEFDDTLKNVIRYYQLKEERKKLVETEFLSYDDNGNLKRSYTLDVNNDTVQSIHVQYCNGNLKSRIHVINKLNNATKELYDVNGCIEKVITIDKSANVSDTVFYECDDLCNVLKIKW